jgi:hypothetical protein
MYRCFGSSESVFGQTDFYQAQKRRQALGPLFSRRATLKLEKELQKHVGGFLIVPTIKPHPPFYFRSMLSSPVSPLSKPRKRQRTYI